MGGAGRGGDAFVNDLQRRFGTYLYGRRMYEVMAAWETDAALAGRSPVTADFTTRWRRADKIVYSTSLAAVATARTWVVRRFDPRAVQQLKGSSERDLAIGGPTLAAHAFKAGLVDEYYLFAVPVVVGGGTPALPDGLRLDLELVDERRIGSGVVYLRYRCR